MNKHVGALLAIGIFSLAGLILSQVDLFPTSPSSDSSPTTPIQQVKKISESDRQESKKIATQFIQAYTSYDAKNPLQYIERIQPYVMPQFYQNHAKRPIREQANVVSTKLKTIKLFPIDGEDLTNLQWNVVAIKTMKLSNGSTIDTEIWYWLTLDKDQDERWKVKGVRADTYGGE